MPKKSKLFDVELTSEEVKDEEVVEEAIPAVEEEEAPVVEEVVEETPVIEEVKVEKKSSFGKVKDTALLNVRRTPGGDILKTIKENDQVTILGEDGDWYMIDNGYVMKKYIQKI